MKNEGSTPPKVWVVPVKIMKVPKVPMEGGYFLCKYYHQVDLRYLWALIEKNSKPSWPLLGFQEETPQLSSK